MSEQRLEKERDFYKKRCNDLGGQVFRLGEDLSRARSDTRRAATAAKLIRQAYESLTDEDEAADVAPKVPRGSWEICGLGERMPSNRVLVQA